jgi:plastocyanin
MKRAITALIVVLALITMSAPAVAGGWASVRLDEMPGDVPIGKPWTFGFMVLQHDITPNSDVTPIVRAINKKTGKEITATAVQEGPVGHFVAELTLPEAGEWKWGIRPEPFAETTLETLIAVDEAKIKVEKLSFPASMHAGSCAKLGDVAFEVARVEPHPMGAASINSAVGVGTGTIDVPLAELIKSGHAVSVGADDPQATSPLVCGDVIGTPNDDELVIGLQPTNGAGAAGIAVLQGKGDKTAVTLYLVAVESDGGKPGKTATIEMLDNWIFNPVKLEATVGTTVTWVNNSGIVHQVTGDDLAFDDSGLIEPGQSFSITFTEPGTYHYHCSPHPGMEGVIVVT